MASAAGAGAYPQQGYGVQGSKHRMRGAGQHFGDPNQLFDDTSASAPPQHGGYSNQGIDMGFHVNAIFSDPMTNVAMAYGSSIANQGKDIVNKEINRFVSINKLKYFFTVDTTYVMKKLALLMFPYMHQLCFWFLLPAPSASQGWDCSFWEKEEAKPGSEPQCTGSPLALERFPKSWGGCIVEKNWEVRYSRDVPLTPRHDVNAPDLYIPTMAFITYVLLAGMALGIQKRFSPEVLGLCASTALVWVVIEVLALLLTLYLVTVQSDLSTFDLLAYSGYKYVGMILTVLSGLLFGSDGYYVTLAWTSCALMYFIVRSLRMKILSTLSSDDMISHSARNRLRMYVTLATAAFQPLIIYWLTFNLV